MRAITSPSRSGMPPRRRKRSIPVHPPAHPGMCPRRSPPRTSPCPSRQGPCMSGSLPSLPCTRTRSRLPSCMAWPRSPRPPCRRSASQRMGGTRSQHRQPRWWQGRWARLQSAYRAASTAIVAVSSSRSGTDFSKTPRPPEISSALAPRRGLSPSPLSGTGGCRSRM